MITLMRNFSVIHNERPHEVLFIQEGDDGKVLYCCIDRTDSQIVGKKVWLKDEEVSLVRIDE